MGRWRGHRWLLDLPYLLFALFPVVDQISWHRPFHVAVLSSGFVLAELIGFAFCVRAALHPGLTPEQRRPWRYLSAWYVLLIVYGGALGASLENGSFAASPTPPLVVAVALKIVAAPTLTFAVMAFLSEPLTGWARRKLALDVTTMIGGAIMVAWYFLIGPGLFDGRSIGGGARLAVTTFPVCDLIVLVGVSTVALRGVVNSARRSLWLVIAGVCGTLAGDIGLTCLSVFAPADQIPVWQDLLGFTSPVLLAAAAIEQCRSATERRRHPADERPLRPYTVLPYIALTAGYLLLLVVAIRAGAFPWPGLVVGAVVMTTAVAARQVVSLRENHLLAVTDTLTGLPNRLLLRESMIAATERSRRTRQPSGLLLIDLDGFKQINDTHGHEAGDAVLIAFAAVLRHHVRETDTPARLGGDEFAVLLDGLDSVQDAVDVAERLLAELRGGPVVSGEPALRVGASIGITVTDPQDPGGPADPHKQLRQADQAMYVAKKAGTTGWFLYSAGLADAVEHAVHEVETRGPARRAEPAAHLAALPAPRAPAEPAPAPVARDS